MGLFFVDERTGEVGYYITYQVAVRWLFYCFFVVAVAAWADERVMAMMPVQLFNNANASTTQRAVDILEYGMGTCMRLIIYMGLTIAVCITIDDRVRKAFRPKKKREAASSSAAR